jgi:prepilin-type N-terminal cleavage/methylation domain-containing protein
LQLPPPDALERNYNKRFTKSTYKNSGFTLAEVLIALVVVGIISAITIPTIIANYQKEALKSGFTKAYADLNNFAKKFYFDKGISFSEYASEHTYSENYAMIQTYIKKEYESSFYKRNFYTTLNGQNKIVNVCDDYGLYVGSGGRYYSINNKPRVGENGPMACVDTNGEKGPNKYGHDFFVFIFTLDNRAIPMGMEDKNNTANTTCSTNCFLSGHQYCDRTGDTYYSNIACSYYALMDKNPTNYSKTYWHDFI